MDRRAAGLQEDPLRRFSPARFSLRRVSQAEKPRSVAVAMKTIR
jgi:hypothetical protein